MNMDVLVTMEARSINDPCIDQTYDKRMQDLFFKLITTIFSHYSYRVYVVDIKMKIIRS